MHKKSCSLLPFACQACLYPFQNKRALSTHLASSLSCKLIIDGVPFQKMGNDEIKQTLLNFFNSKLPAFSTKIVEMTDNNQIVHNESDKSSEETSIAQSISSMEDDDSYEPYHFSNDDYQEIKLLKLLNDLGTPLYAYQKIMEWAKEAHLSNYNFDSQHPTSHKQMITYLEQKLQFKLCQPTIIPVTLLHDNFQADVAVFDVRQMLMSLFDS